MLVRLVARLPIPSCNVAAAVAAADDAALTLLLPVVLTVVLSEEFNVDEEVLAVLL